MAVPTWSVLIDWDNDGTWDHALSDVSAYLADTNGMDWTMGRSADFGTEATGSASLTLRNPASRYDAVIRPGVDVRIMAIYGGTTYPRFTGRIQRWNADPVKSELALTVYDPLQAYSEIDVVVPANAYVTRCARDLRVEVLADAERGDRNLVANPSFETDLTGWGGGTNMTLTRIITDHALTGSACAKMVATGVATVNYQSRMAPVFFAGPVYRLSMYLKADSGTPSVTIQLGSATRAVTLSTSWVRYTVTETRAAVGSGNSGYTLAVIFAGAMTVYMDCVSLTRGQALYPYSDVGTGRWPNWCGNGGFDGGGLNGWYGAWTNICTNGSFEVNANGWVTVTRSAGDHMFGSACGSLNSGQTGTYNLAGTFANGIPYRFNFWAKVTGGGSTAKIWDTFTSDSSTPAAITGTGVWELCSVDWTPTGDRTTGQLSFTNNDVGVLLLDGVQVVRHDPASSDGPGYSDVGPGGGGAYSIASNSAVQVKYGGFSQAAATTAVAGAGRVYDFNHWGAYFLGGQPYTISVWLRSSAAATPVKVGIGANKGDGTWDEASTTGTVGNGAWSQFTVTWTPSADRSSANPFNIVLYLWQTDATARTIYIDGVRVIPGSTADDFEMAQWALAAGAETTDTYWTTATLTDTAAGALATLNRLTLSRHWIRPTLTAPYWQYVTASRSDSHSIAATISSFKHDPVGMEFDRQTIVNVVAITYATATEYYSDPTSVGLAAGGTGYGSRPGAAVDGTVFFGNRAIPDIIGPLLVTAGASGVIHPTITVENTFPAMLQRDLNDKVTATLPTPLGTSDWFILTMTTRVDAGGRHWATTYVLGTTS